MSDEALMHVIRTTVDSKAERFAGLAVGVLADGSTATYGVGRIGAQGAAAAHTLLQIGSVTKTFTAVALADAVCRGELRLSTRLADVLPRRARPCPASRSSTWRRTHRA